MDGLVTPLRDDLRLFEASPGIDGEPAWMIQDIVTNRFYRIGWLEFETLLRWGKPPPDIAADIAAETPLRPDTAQIERFSAFLDRHDLLRRTGDPGQRDRGEGPAWLTWRWWLHHYLFFRIPLLRPHRFLRRLTRRVAWLFTPWTAYAVAALAVLGIVLVARQWDEFTGAVADSFSAEGLVGFAVAIALAKTLHELGHAVVATRHGLRVAHMGIAFVVMWPMLYTDTSEAWRLRHPRQRLAVAGAGIATELIIAALSTLGWALAEPGMLRAGLLYLATTSWVLTLALNASPFTRFDGYYILCDLLDIPNLHERASAMGRVTLRRVLLGLDEPWPERVSPRRRRLLTGFAFATWLYRLVLFFGIAVAVYLFFFKALGIFLFAVEVSWFIALPVLREALGLLAVPWRSQIHAYGVARSDRQLQVFAPFPARLHGIHAPGRVRRGDVLVALEQPDLTLREAGNEATRQGYEGRLAGLMADPAGNDDLTAVEQRMAVESREIGAARAETARLTLRAPFDGQWSDIDRGWQAGTWIGTKESVGTLYDPQHWSVDAYVKQDDVGRFRVGSPVRFYPDGMPGVLRGTVTDVGGSRVAQLDYPMLAQRFGGPLNTAKQEKTLVPTPALFHVVIRLERPLSAGRETRGHVQIEGERKSPLGQSITWLMSVAIRESGF
jgi:putative peptide zinc metalloprotease protein